MALKLEIKKVKGDLGLCIKTDTKTATLNINYKEDKDQEYEFSLLKLTFQKKMYQPTVINALVLINSLEIPNSEGQRQAWNPISKDTLNTLFLNKQVELTSVEGESGKTIGKDYYVQEVLPSYKKKQLILTLKIYSPDKLLTLEHNSRTFVSKKLGDGIMKSVMPKMPYSTSSIKYDIANMKVLAYKKKLDKLKDKSKWSNQDTPEYEEKEVTTEHIFPYLVQYNESIYDMLARTCNRWGEFMYYENEQLNVGYSTTDKEVITNEDASKNKFNTITYVNIDEVEPGDHFDRPANSDDNFLNGNLLKKDPNDLGIKADMVVMKEISSFFKNEKNIPTHLANRLFDNAYDLASRAIKMAYNNSEFNNKYFTDSLRNAGAEKFNGNHSSYDSCDLFTEFKSDSDSFDFSNEKYGSILSKEYAAAKDSVCIDFDTNYPDLKLGQVIEVYSKEYIVVQIDCKPDYEQKIINSMWVVDNDDNPSLVYKVIATAKDSDSNFYPTMIPSGHVRFADPQMATVFDASDPAKNGRVRVHFPWQAKYDEEQNPSYKDDEATPWLQFTANAGGKDGIMGQHYKEDKVFVGFLDGNVERPYVLGAISNGAGSDVHCATPGGHILKLKDDPSGVSKFLTGMLMPGWGTLADFVPQMGKLPETKGETGIKLGGGFELSDYYGIYKISGSTDSREVNVASPWGEVKINAFRGITISAPNGDIAIKGKNIKIEAGNNLELISGTNIKNKIMGGDGEGFFADIAVAVTKKLAEMALNAIDLSIIRSTMEIIFRPAEGQLRIKSNRFLMLDAGKGDCVYPENAYSSADEYNNYMKEQSKKYSKDGLRLSTGILEVIARVQTLGDLVDNNYRVAYNKCIDKLAVFNTSIDKAKVWAENYDTKPDEAFCKTYANLKDDMWKNPSTVVNFDEAKLEFTQNYSTTDISHVKSSMALHCARTVKKYPITKRPAEKILKQDVLDIRKEHVAIIINAAKDLRQAIVDFLSLPELKEEEIKALTHSFKDRKMPKEFMGSLVNAFKKTELGDCYYYLPIDDEKRKGLKELSAPLTKVTTAPHRLVLKRKAAILLLEGMGFKDEWRKKVVPAAPAPAPTSIQVNPASGGAPVLVALAPVAPPPPPAPQLEVKREFDSAKLDDAYWTNYANSIVTIPELKPDEWKVTKELKKMAVDKLNNNMFWEVPTENKAWGENKHGAILFSEDAKVYRMDKEISEVPAPPRGNLTEEDNINNDVTDLLTKIRTKLTSFN